MSMLCGIRGKYAEILTMYFPPPHFRIADAEPDWAPSTVRARALKLWSQDADSNGHYTIQQPLLWVKTGLLRPYSYLLDGLFLMLLQHK